MDWIIALLSFGALIWWLRSLSKKQTLGVTQTPHKPTASNPTVYQDYHEELVRKPIEKLDEEEQIIRRAHDAFAAERANRDREYRAKKASLAADEKKIQRATEFINTSYLSIALPFVQEETQHWPSWSKMDESRWKAPMQLSDVNGSTTSGTIDEWVEFRAEGGPLYKIGFEKSRRATDADYEYGYMTLFVDGEEVLAMFVKRDYHKEWARWYFSTVKSLKVGPWIEDFMAFYNRLRSTKENESEDRMDDYVREKAAKIDLG